MNMRGQWLSGLGLACAISACETTLIEGVSTGDAQRLAELLDTRGIAARVETTSTEQTRLVVGNNDLARAVTAVREDALSHAPPQATSDSDPSLLPTRSEQTTRRANGIARQLEHSIERVPGVAAARVHIALPVVPAFANELSARPQASVLVQRTERPVVLDASGLQKLVAGAVPGLAAEAVSIVEVVAAQPRNARRSWTRVGPWTVAEVSARQLRATLFALLTLQTVLALVLIVVVARAQRTRRLSEVGAKN